MEDSITDTVTSITKQPSGVVIVAHNNGQHITLPNSIEDLSIIDN